MFVLTFALFTFSEINFYYKKMRNVPLKWTVFYFIKVPFRQTDSMLGFTMSKIMES
jgi:hypothetical protein